MSILSNYPNLDHIYCETAQQLSNLSCPKNSSFSIHNFTDLIQTVDRTTRELALTLIQKTLEDMDDAYFNSQERIRDFTVKVKRIRTLITVFGQVQFTRRIYQSKLDGHCFTYVDRKVGLPRYDRYDPTVKAKVVEAYANNNSMLKVGQIVGEYMFTSFSLNSERKHYNLSRQTVHNIVKNIHRLYPKIDRRDNTPKVLYLMADEKYVSLQKSDKNSAMVKHCVLFEGFERKNKRITLVNKLTFSSLESKFWEHVHDTLAQIYDFDKIEKIVLMGDGAHWIKAGAYQISKSIFILDKFHTYQAITAMTQDETIRHNLREALENDDKETFNELIEVLKDQQSDNEARIKSIEDKSNYLTRHWEAIQRAHDPTLPGCSMEAHISHNIASLFTSRPKSYAVKHLGVYLSTRDLHLNQVDILDAYIRTLSYDKSDKLQSIEKEMFDLSMFEPKTNYDKSSSSNWVKGFISKH